MIRCLKLLALGLSLTVSATTWAAPISPTFDEFGTLAGATFGGSGIPNDAVAITRFDAGGNAPIVLGLTATQRFFNPPLSNDGAGTFTAKTGANTGGPGSTSALQGALWNFGTYVEIPAGLSLDNLFLEFLYDFDPAAGTDDSVLGRTTLTPLSLLPVGVTEASENLLFGFLAVPSAAITPPVFGPFDPNAAGEYSFALRIRDATGGILASTAILVNVVPEPGAIGLVAFGLISMVAVRRRRQRG